MGAVNVLGLGARTIVGDVIRTLLPSAAWDGTAGSGFVSAPSDPTRTTAKPIVRLLDPPDQYFTDSLTVSVMAFANNGGTLDGGIERVRFHFEGRTIDVGTPALRQFTRFDGTTYVVPCYTVRLKKPSATAGAAQLYVEAIPSDGAMQSRVLGPYTFNLATTLHDLELQVSPSLSVVTGSRYQTLGAALSYIATQSAKNPKITITEAGTYNPTGSPASPYTPTGFVTIEATAAATIGFASAQANDTAAQFRCRVNGLWFRGENITLDFRHMLQLYVENSARPHVFEGVTLTNSAGREALWNGGTRPINPLTYSTSYPRGSDAWYLDCSITQMANGAVNANLVRGCMIDEGYGDACTGSKAIVGCKSLDYNSKWWASDVPALTVQGPSGATLTLPGGNDVNSRTLTAAVSGTTVGTLTVTKTTLVSDVAAFINGLSGWSATVVSNARRASALTVTGTKGVGFTNRSVSSPVTFACMFDIHGDFFQQPFGDASGCDNILIYGNTLINWCSQIGIVNQNSPGPTDWAIINNAVYNDPDNTTPYALNSAFFTQFGGNSATHSHVILAHNSFCNQGVLLRDDLSLSQDAYCLFACDAVRSMRWSSAAVGSGVIKDNHVHTTGGAPQGATGTTTGGNESTLFVNAAAGNFTPAGALVSNPKTPVFQWDINGNKRAATAPAGAVA